MFAPVIKPKGISIDNDDKGLYLYLGFNVITGLVLILSFIFLSNIFMFIMNILAWFFYTVKNFYTILFIVILGMVIELVISMIIIMLIRLLLIIKIKILYSTITKVFYFVLKYAEGYYKK